MNDPAYRSGVDPESIIKTVFDIGDVFKGRLSCITAPTPMDGSSPVTHMSFADANAEFPEPLNIGVKSPGSRRSHIYNIKHGIDIPAVNNTVKVPTVDDEYEIHDDDEVHVEDVQEYSVESVVHFIENINPINRTSEVKLSNPNVNTEDKQTFSRRRRIN